MTPDLTLRQREMRRKCRGWIILHPFGSCRQAFAWWRFKRVPPWRLPAVQLVFVDPRPLSPAELANLRHRIKEISRG